MTPLIIGISASSGSGKSFILNKIVEAYNFPFYEMDKACKNLINTIPELRSDIINIIGIKAFLNNNEYNTKYVSNIIFSNKIKKAELENAIGKYLKLDYFSWIEKNKESNILLVECAYFFELNISNWVDLIIGISSDYDLKIKRIIERDSITKEQAEIRINSQMNQSLLLQRSNFIITNNLSSNIEEQITKIFTLIFKIMNI